MKRDEIKKWREATEEEIGIKIDELKKQLFNLSPQVKIGQLKNCSIIKNIKKDISVLMTIQSEKKLERANE